MNILEEAQAVVYGPRAEAYGHPSKNFDRIARLWNAYTGLDLSHDDVALMMVLVKVARLQETPRHRDSLVDIAGYAATVERLDDA